MGADTWYKIGPTICPHTYHYTSVEITIHLL